MRAFVPLFAADPHAHSRWNAAILNAIGLSGLYSTPNEGNSLHEGSEAAGPHVHGITDRLDSRFLRSHAIALSEDGAPIVAKLEKEVLPVCPPSAANSESVIFGTSPKAGIDERFGDLARTQAVPGTQWAPSSFPCGWELILRMPVRM